MIPPELSKLADLGFPYVLLFLIAFGLRSAWRAFWPWFVGDFWKSREERWKRQFEAGQAREALLQQQATAFLSALDTFTNGMSESLKEIASCVETIQRELREHREVEAE